MDAPNPRQRQSTARPALASTRLTFPGGRRGMTGPIGGAIAAAAALAARVQVGRAGRAPACAIAARSTAENRRCLPMYVAGISRSPAFRRSHDSGTESSCAACPGVSNTGPSASGTPASPASARGPMRRAFRRAAAARSSAGHSTGASPLPHVLMTPRHAGTTGQTHNRTSTAARDKSSVGRLETPPGKQPTLRPASRHLA